MVFKIYSDAEILKMLKETGKTQHELADYLGISRSKVAHAIRREQGKPNKKGYAGHFDAMFTDKTKQGFEERKPRVFKDDDIWTIVSAGRHGHTVKISEEALRHLKKLYCLEHLTINQVCREMQIPRRDFYLIKTAFAITKDDAPYIDEDLINHCEDELVADSLQEKKRLYFIKLQQQEIEQLRKENNKYRKQDYLIDKLDGLVSAHMQEFARRYRGPGEVKRVTNDANFMLEFPVVDLHSGKLGWAPEVGESYDYKIARKRYEHVVDDVYCRAEPLEMEKIVIVIGNDHFHYDNIEPTTTAGTRQDTDTRWQQLYGVNYEVIIWAVDRFSHLAPVELLHIPGNHDWMASWHAMMYLHAWYRNSDRVKVNTDPKSRKYVEYGKNLIGYTHGDKEGKRIIGNMQVEAAPAWGRTLHREWHTGHLHSEQVKEENGVIVRRLSSITGPDSWHFTHGYIGALPKQQTFIWHKQRGLTEIWHTPILI